MSEQQALSQIYLDANATTPVLAKAAKAALSTMETMFGNPSSSHISGLQAKQIMDETRNKAVKVLGAGSGQVIFTSGATEGIQTGILSALYAAKKSMQADKEYSILYGATEHKAVPESLKHWNKILEINATVKPIPVDEMGKLDMDFIAKEVPNALMICTMAVNNETGVYQDLDALELVIRGNNANVFWMVDCVQALGKRCLELASTSIDYAPFSGHKLYAPKGIGFVYIRKGAPFTPFIAGGGQEGGLRSGTENLPGLAALNVIFDELLEQGDGVFASVGQLQLFRTQMALALKNAFPTVVFNHDFTNSVPTTLNFAIPGFSSKEIMDLFDAANIRVSSGSACSSKVTRSFVLDAMGLPAWQSESAIRMSFGPAVTQQQIDQACDRIAHCAQALGHSCLLNAMGNIDEKSQLQGLVQFKVGGSCTWLYADPTTKTAVIVDPLPELTNRLLTILQCQQLQLVAAIDTHGHADHQSGRVELAKQHLAMQHTNHLGWPEEVAKIELDGQSYEAISIGDKYLLRIATPGHTDDSISLVLCDKHKLQHGQLAVSYVFCGDLVLMGSLGRTNFSTSSAQLMFNSLKTLFDLVGDDALLCPSHDYHNEFVTNFAAERSRNQLLNGVLMSQLSEQQFMQNKADLDKNIHDQIGEEVMCGAFTSSCNQKRLQEYNTPELKAKLNSTPGVKLIDIREPHEYALNHSQEFDMNVPLTRLADFICQQQCNKSQELILVCRSGSRSQVAAQALNRLGFEHVGHLKGGYALSQAT
ncbi:MULTISPECIES: aminotransferase class V-fold PLP-dependent enzyme [Pseudoalteromonas]|uniref:cysteine desulfurase n=1 Tax=Pseudoalteromonas amylolytica TaxID=1859457 RepID=A0A1S1MPC3_9GAMM|nr:MULTISPECIES: aminotransferase class V-fold PLP-dependent enzyme [Pseudoalteromonas]OHU85037.1 aminotransferase class V [Pseudoalteromonas sp. JW3]OHU90011.1 aminotransferase class V [Pseudoalteromonas amylolytica]